MTTFADHVANRRALIAAGTIHPASLIDLAQNRLMRLREWADGSEYHARQVAEAAAVLSEAKAETELFNERRAS